MHLIALTDSQIEALGDFLETSIAPFILPGTTLETATADEIDGAGDMPIVDPEMLTVLQKLRETSAWQPKGFETSPESGADDWKDS